MDNHQRFIGGLWSTGESSRGSTWISSQIWGLTYLNRKTCFSHSVFYPLSSHAFCLGRALFSAFTWPVNVNMFNGKFVSLSGLRFSARRRQPPQEKDDSRSVAGKTGCPPLLCHSLWASAEHYRDGKKGKQILLRKIPYHPYLPNMSLEQLTMWSYMLSCQLWMLSVCRDYRCDDKIRGQKFQDFPCNAAVSR